MARNKHTCATCVHDGCCDGLPNCGGTCWQNAYGECAQCGNPVRLDDVEWQSEDGSIFCSESCLGAWEVERGEDGDEDE